MASCDVYVSLAQLQAATRPNGATWTACWTTMTRQSGSEPMMSLQHSSRFHFFCRQTWLILQSRPLDGFIKPAKSRFRDPAGKRNVLHSQFWGRTDSWSVSCDQCRLKLPEWTAKQPQSKCSFVLTENQTVIWSHSPFKPSLLLQLRACDSEKLVRIKVWAWPCAVNHSASKFSFYILTQGC